MGFEPRTRTPAARGGRTAEGPAWSGRRPLSQGRYSLPAFRTAGPFEPARPSWWARIRARLGGPPVLEPLLHREDE